MIEEALRSLPFVNKLGEATVEALKQHAEVREFDVDTRIHEDDDPTCDSLVLIVSGRLRIYKMNEEGKEATLYDVIDGEACLLSLRCLLEGKPYDVQIETKEPSRIVFIPAFIVHRWLLEEPAFLQHLLKITLTKVDTLMWHYESMSFAPIKQRISLYLYEKSRHYRTSTVYTTHQQIADEIGASREAVSRTLKTLERQGHLRLSRGRLHLQGRLPLL